MNAEEIQKIIDDSMADAIALAQAGKQNTARSALDLMRGMSDAECRHALVCMAGLTGQMAVLIDASTGTDFLAEMSRLNREEKW